MKGRHDEVNMKCGENTKQQKKKKDNVNLSVYEKFALRFLTKKKNLDRFLWNISKCQRLLTSWKDKPSKQSGLQHKPELKLQL